VSLWVDREDADAAGSLRGSLGRHFDGLVDLVGGHMGRSLQHVVQGGVAASIVDLEGNFETAIDRNITIHGVLVRPDADALDKLSRELGDHLRPHIRRVYPLDAAADAHRSLAAGQVNGKLVLSIDAGG
jgi:NADPH:quinone reductase-like Zn-dependent oxidoreductase